jgi:hypothetical protein
LDRITPQFRSVIRFVRLALGLVVACVFAGRVEAATQHCVRLAHEASAISAEATPEAAACHMVGMDKPTKTPARHAPKMAACECIAFAKSVSTPTPLLASSRIAAFAWERPQVEAFASLDLVPEGPPPKA